MNEDLTRLRRWLRRAEPPRVQLWRALVAGFVAAATNVALLVGAIALLVESSSRPGLHAVAAVLVVIELLAFLRSPLRFSERLLSHRLGYSAVTRWRRWLVLVIGQLNYSTWRSYASGDLLERALGDTDELQDLWLRFVIPFLDVIAVMVVSDVVVAVLPPHGGWWAYAINLLILQVICVVALVLLARRELTSDRELRAARGNYRAELVELSTVSPELALLQRTSFAEARSAVAVKRLSGAEKRRRRDRRASDAVVVIASLLALAAVASHPATSSVWLVVATMIGFSTYESLLSVRSSLRAAIEVSGGGERLEALANNPHRGATPWPGDSTIELVRVSLEEDEKSLVHDATLVITPGEHVAIVGESGTGKSTLLRAIARLDPVGAGSITIGQISIEEIKEDELRVHLAYVASEPGLTRGFAKDVVLLGRPTTRDIHADLAELGIESERTTRFDELSRGERVRVALARSLVSSPDIIVLDEPTAGLGADETRRVLELLGSSSATVVIATHDRAVSEWCDVIVELHEGELDRLSR